MSALGENEPLDEIVIHLAARFPTLSPAYVRRIVGDERHRLESGAVRDFGPTHVERAAMEQLRKEADPVRLRDEDGAARPAGDLQELDPMERERREREQHGVLLLEDLGGAPS
jgi:hypothetical protein